MTEVHKEFVENGIILSCEFNAPRELVFRTLSESDLIKQWWGPEGFPVNNSTMDFRPGGQWLYSMRSDETGEEHWSKASYVEIVAPEKIVWTDAFCDSAGNVIEDLPQGSMSITLTEKDGITTFRNEVALASNEERDQIVAMGMLEGMTMTLNQLEDLLAKLAA